MMKISKSFLFLLALLLPVTVFAESTVYTSVDELRGKKVAAIGGAITGGIVSDYFNGDVTVEYYNSNSDMAVAVDSGKADAYIADVLAARLQCETYTKQNVLEPSLKENPVGFFFPKDDEAGTALCNQVNEFLAVMKAEGKLDELDVKWNGKDESTKKIDRTYSGENGTLMMACSPSIGIPFCYLQNGDIVGYEIELASLFCQAYGYRLELMSCDYAAMLNAVSSGKCQFGGTATSITPARQESVLFSDPTYAIRFVLTVRGNTADAAPEPSFFSKVAVSFRRTFVEENRWKDFLIAMGRTLLLTLLAVIFGTILGFLLFMGWRKGNRIFNGIVRFFIWLIEGMPVVVLLMVLFYVIFGKTAISGFATAVIAFTLIFGITVLNLLEQALKAIDPGQLEAVKALGYTDTYGFLKRIMPQLVTFSLPAFKAQVSGLLKATAIVGYIAVQDLTKCGDLIRSRTYEAFFPLIATTVFYFILAALLGAVITRVRISTDPRRRKTIKALKGVNVR